jgi:hypothetical protein
MPGINALLAAGSCRPSRSRREAEKGLELPWPVSAFLTVLSLRKGTFQKDRRLNIRLSSKVWRRFRSGR